MTRRQANWAESHDWWLASMEDWNNNFEVVVREQGQTEVLQFTNFDKLYNWAGY